MSEGLPVHRREHERQDTAFAYKYELDAWNRLRTKCPCETLSDEAEVLSPDKPANNTYLTEHDAITRTVHCYIAGARAGDGELMRPAFHPSATISGYCQGVEYSGSVEHVFDWINQNGPAPEISPRFARIEIIESIAVVHLEVQRWSDKLAGAQARASDVFTLLKCNGEWKITHKLFHGTTGNGSHRCVKYYFTSPITRHYRPSLPVFMASVMMDFLWSDLHMTHQSRS